MAYDPNNVFAKILRGEIPSKKLYEDEYALAFFDVHPQAPVHVLVIPKGSYENHFAFVDNASDAELLGFERALGRAVQLANLTEGGYRVISNCGLNGGQEVPHYHVHIVGGGPLGRMLTKRD